MEIYYIFVDGVKHTQYKTLKKSKENFDELIISCPYSMWEIYLEVYSDDMNEFSESMCRNYLLYKYFDGNVEKIDKFV